MQQMIQMTEQKIIQSMNKWSSLNSHPYTSILIKTAIMTSLTVASNFQNTS